MFRRGRDFLKPFDWAAILGSALAVAFCLLVLVPWEKQPRTQAGEQYQTCEYYRAIGSAPRGLFNGFGCWIDGVKDDLGAISTLAIALFTIVLAYSTIGLWRQTERLAEGADDQSKKMVMAINATLAVSDRTKEVADAMGKVAKAMADVAYQTEALAIQTRESSTRQASQTQQSIAVATKAADAADLSAKAAIGVELPFLHIESVSFSNIPTSDTALWLSQLIPKVIVKNFGRTPAFVYEVAVNGRIGFLPSKPSYIVNYPNPDPVVIDGRATLTHEEWLFANGASFSKEEIATYLADATVFLYIFGYIAFHDFLGREHKKGGCYYHFAGGTGFIEAPGRPQYNYAT
jgi:hypothetical protein